MFKNHNSLFYSIESSGGYLFKIKQPPEDCIKENKLLWLNLNLNMAKLL